MDTLAIRKLAELRKLQALLLEQQKADQAIAIQRAKNSLYRKQARKQQLPPDGDWRIWLILSGRGFGKTWTGSRWLLEQCRLHPGTDWFIAAPTFADVKKICIEGPSGLWKALERDELVSYNKTELTIKLKNGCTIFGLSADQPDRARGYNFSGGWLDEFSSWRYDEMWTEGLAPALRIGNPQVVITTTPRPTKLIKEFSQREDGSVVVTRGSTFDNAANLSPAALAELKARYEGTRLGRQELYGELLDDVEGALWNHADILRVATVPDLVRIVVAVDPAVTSGEDSDETGIVVVAKGVDGMGYVLADRSCRDTPSGWAHRVIAAYEEFGADRVVAEKNQGGDMVEQTLRSVMPTVPFTGVSARQGKRLRAEPVAALYEQHRIHHVKGLDTLEDQMISWVPDSGTSPDRIDALVHGFAELSIAGGGAFSGAFFQQLKDEKEQTQPRGDSLKVVSDPVPGNRGPNFFGR